jgi:hypothetical protein
VSNVVIEAYNTLLTLEKMRDLENIVVFDNESLHRIFVSKLKIPNPSFDELNSLVVQIMSGCTASVRFVGQNNLDLSNLYFVFKFIDTF